MANKPHLSKLPVYVSGGSGGADGKSAYEIAVDNGFEGDEQARSEEHTSELQSRFALVCRLLLEKKKPSNNEYDRLFPAIREIRRGPAPERAQYRVRGAGWLRARAAHKVVHHGRPPNRRQADMQY